MHAENVSFDSPHDTCTCKSMQTTGVKLACRTPIKKNTWIYICNISADVLESKSRVRTQSKEDHVHKMTKDVY